MSNKATSAENQQERLDANWLVGFTDGEGCFSISFVKNETMKSGYQIFTEFVITQGERSAKVLEKIKDFFGAGGIYKNRRYDDHREDIYRYCVRSRKDLLAKVCPFFDEHPLMTDKSYDYQVFRQVLRMMEQGEHLTEQGFAKIKDLAATTNRRKKRLESPTTDTPEPSNDGKIQSDLYGDIEVTIEQIDSKVTITTI